MTPHHGHDQWKCWPRAYPEKSFYKIFTKGKRGQVTIFIIIGIIIVSAIVLFFLFKSGVKIPGIGVGKEINPPSFLESCMEDKIKEAVNLISFQGGYIENPLNIYFKFEEENSPVNISYLCYNQADYFPCVNQEPMLLKHLKEEIYNYISDDVRNCFDSLTLSLDKQGYTVDSKYRGFEINLEEKKIIINIDAEITLTKSGETTKQENFEIIILSRFYDLAIVVQEIINKEATTCEFNHYNMFSYPNFDINKYKTSDSSVIYKIKHEDSNEEFRFAVRGCIMPPGFGLELE